MTQIDVIVGTCGRAHGLAGELFVNLVTDSPELRFAVGATLWVGQHELTVDKFRRQGPRGIVRFREAEDRTSAEARTGHTLVAKVDAGESPAGEDEFFDHQLVGLTVITPAGVSVGQVTRVDHRGFQDLLAVAAPTGEKLVPFVSALVPSVDVAGGTITVRPIPGLLDDDAVMDDEEEP